ncbi:hypothetical protein SALBM135S_04250 [Streptomyces alboniger]
MTPRMARAAISESRLVGLRPSLRTIRSPLRKSRQVRTRMPSAPSASSEQAMTVPAVDSDRRSRDIQAMSQQTAASPRTTALPNLRLSRSIRQQKTRKSRAAGA